MSPARLAYRLNLLRASYWFIPTVMVLAAFALALGAGAVDVATTDWWDEQASVGLTATPDGARAILSAIAGSMITVAGVTFSMTMVAVSFAAAQFGPRLIGNFMRDTGNQVSLGVFIATFVYCLVVLRMVRSAETGDGDGLFGAFVPQTAVHLGLLLAVACIGVLIYFIHHVPETINVGNITASVGRRLKDSIADMFPAEVGDAADSGPKAAAELEKIQARFHEGPQVDACCEGYVVSVEADRLVAIAHRHNTLIKLQHRAGDFVVGTDPLATLPRDLSVDDDFAAEIRSCFAFGRERTAEQNLLFLVDELVEIMGRALSPGVNDPFTAYSCINWLRCGLGEMASASRAAVLRRDDAGTPRLVSHALTFDRFAAAVFDQSKQYVSGDRNAAVAMMRMLGEVAVSTEPGPRRDTLLRHADALAEAGRERLPVGRDQEELSALREQVQRLVEDPDAREQWRQDQGWFGGTA